METAGAPDFDPWNPDRLRLPPGTVGEARASARPPRHRPGEAFLRGPIAYEWVATAARLPGSGLHVATTVRFLCDRFRHPNRWGLEAIATGLGLTVRSAQRGLHAAEEAGLLSVSREPGCKLAARVLRVPEPEAGPRRQPLYGPIPWAWWLAALRLPGASLHAATACWLAAGWARSARIEFPMGDWADLGLSRQASGRGLDCLEAAGLISISSRPGGSPSVLIRDSTTRPG